MKVSKSGPVATSDPATEIADVRWEGDSKEILRDWPVPIRGDFGFSLREMQKGRPATLDVRPMRSVGSGVFELKTDDEASWYRLMYVARVDDVIYVLDCFKKDTTKTERKDIALSQTRYKQIKQRLLEEKKNAKRDEQANPRNKR